MLNEQRNHQNFSKALPLMAVGFERLVIQLYSICVNELSRFRLNTNVLLQLNKVCIIIFDSITVPLIINKPDPAPANSAEPLAKIPNE